MLKSATSFQYQTSIFISNRLLYHYNKIKVTYYVEPTVSPHKGDWNYLKFFSEDTSSIIYPYNAWQEGKKKYMQLFKSTSSSIHKSPTGPRIKKRECIYQEANMSPSQLLRLKGTNPFVYLREPEVKSIHHLFSVQYCTSTLATVCSINHLQ